MAVSLEISITLCPPLKVAVENQENDFFYCHLEYLETADPSVEIPKSKIKTAVRQSKAKKIKTTNQDQFKSRERDLNDKL